MSETVLVIENGEIDNSSATLIPNAVTWPSIAAMYDIQSAPDANLGNARFAVTVGNVVGGGSIVNGMLYQRAGQADYDAWKTLGNNGWDWRNMLNYFKKSTTFTPPEAAQTREFDIRYDANFYGRDGPLQASYPPFQYPDMKNIWASMKAEDVAFPKEHGSGNAVGAFWAPTCLDPKTRTRSHARNAYCDKVASTRKNLKLLTGHRVTEIIFNGLTADGVQVLSHANNKVTPIYARQEVVLAAGAIFAPQLLQLSGLGPKDVLEAANIKVRKDIPGVGANFQDHPAAISIYNLQNLSFPNPDTLTQNATFNASAWQEYTQSATGPYTQAHGNTFAFLSLSQITKDWSTIVSQIRNQKNPLDYLPAIYKTNPSLLRGFQAQRDIILNMLSTGTAAAGEIPLTASGTSITALQHPLSRGTIHLDPKNPTGNPVVTYNTFQNPADSAVLASIVRWVRKHWSRPALANYSPTEILPGPNAVTDEAIIGTMAGAGLILPSFSHPSGSCAMMPERYGGVVDEQLRVYGVKKLRIVDASILPLIPAAHIQATMYAVAEKAADLIKMGPK